MREDPKLLKIKAILQRLHDLSDNPSETDRAQPLAGAADKGKDYESLAPLQVVSGREHRTAVLPSHKIAQLLHFASTALPDRRLAMRATTVTAGLVLVLVAGLLLTSWENRARLLFPTREPSVQVSRAVAVIDKTLADALPWVDPGQVPAIRPVRLSARREARLPLLPVSEADAMDSLSVRPAMANSLERRRPSSVASLTPGENAVPNELLALTLPRQGKDREVVLDFEAAPVSLTSITAVLANGEVQLARKLLLAGHSLHSPEKAWMMARTYDPVVLRSIRGADAPPDRAKAEYWYRRWHQLSVKHGLVSRYVSVEPLILAMKNLVNRPE